MLIEMAVADAYGIGFEFVDRENWPGANDLTVCYQHPTYTELLPGQYTDDTQRAIANARVVIAGGHLDVRAYADAYVNVYAEDPREGYSRRYQEFLKTHPDSREFLLDVRRVAKSNGSLMGVVPLGVINDIREVKLAAMIQALSTHAPSTAVHAQIVALAAHYLYHELGNPSDLIEFLKANADLEDEWSYRSDKTTPTTIRAKSVVNTLLTGLQKFNSTGTLTEMMQWAVDLEGDTDSAAATLVGVASLGHRYYVNDINSPNPTPPPHPLLLQVFNREGQDRYIQLNELDIRLYSLV